MGEEVEEVWAQVEREEEEEIPKKKKKTTTTMRCERLEISRLNDESVKEEGKDESSLYICSGPCNHLVANQVGTLFIKIK